LEGSIGDPWDLVARIIVFLDKERGRFMIMYDAKHLTDAGKVNKKSPQIIKGSGTFSAKTKGGWNVFQ
jgi:hypothetical protein